MNVIRERILMSITKYEDYSKYRDLISFGVDAEHFTDWDDDDHEIVPDFDELIVVVEKNWLFRYMDVEDPLDYLQNEYTSDDSIDWFDEAIRHNKVVMVAFN